MEAPNRLMHLLIFTAWKVNGFGEDAFAKVTAHCKLSANIVNFLLEKNRVLFPARSWRKRVPIHVRLLNDEFFKCNVFDLIQCVSNTNLQRYYVGDGEGNMSLAGLGVPAVALTLTSGVQPVAEDLFKRALHEVKGLVDSQLYLKKQKSEE